MSSEPIICGLCLEPIDANQRDENGEYAYLIWGMFIAELRTSWLPDFEGNTQSIVILCPKCYRNIQPFLKKGGPSIEPYRFLNKNSEVIS